MKILYICSILCCFTLLLSGPIIGMVFVSLGLSNINNYDGFCEVISVENIRRNGLICSIEECTPTIYEDFNWIGYIKNDKSRKYIDSNINGSSEYVDYYHNILNSSNQVRCNYDSNYTVISLNPYNNNGTSYVIGLVFLGITCLFLLISCLVLCCIILCYKRKTFETIYNNNPTYIPNSIEIIC